MRAPLNPPLGLQVLCVDCSAVKLPARREPSPGRGRFSGCSRTRGLHDLANYAAKMIEKRRRRRSSAFHGEIRPRLHRPADENVTSRVHDVAMIGIKCRFTISKVTTDRSVRYVLKAPS